MENNVETSEVKNNPEPIETRKSKIKKHLENAWDLLKFASIALAIVIPIRMFIAQPFVVSGSSMVPTFHDGQYLIVDEISYILGNPHRSDVVIFRYPKDPSRFFIKRIIGMPNEQIKIENGKVTISSLSDKTKAPITLSEPYINEHFGTLQTYTTGPDEYFVMGDNRNYSSDSRYWGILPRKLMIGRAFLRLLPINTLSYLPGSYTQAQ